MRACKLCGGETRARFSARLADRWTAEYFECVECHLLQSFHLDDLSSEGLTEVYTTPRPEDGDPGAPWRVAHVGRRIEHLAKLRMFPRYSDGRVLDFGSGSNFVAAYVGHRLGIDAWGYEPYGSSAFAAERTLTRWEEVRATGPFQLVVASEVFEHFLRPREEIIRLREVLASPGALFVTTGRYVPGRHGSDWPYLAPHSGQHVAFYSAEAMQEVAKLLGFTHVFTVGGPNEWLLTSPGTTKRRLHLSTGAALLRGAARAGFPDKADMT